MTRKDFELIAEVLLNSHHELPSVAGDGRCYICCMAKRFADKLKETNSLFDRSKFLKACGVKE